MDNGINGSAYKTIGYQIYTICVHDYPMEKKNNLEN
jgi:hypothetical protein